MDAGTTILVEDQPRAGDRADGARRDPPRRRARGRAREDRRPLGRRLRQSECSDGARRPPGCPDADDEARAFLATLDRANRYAILYRVQDAKRPETRARRIEKYVAMLREHRKIHE